MEALGNSLALLSAVFFMVSCATDNWSTFTMSLDPDHEAVYVASMWQMPLLPADPPQWSESMKLSDLLFPIPAQYDVLCDPIPDASIFTCYNQCREENKNEPFYNLCCRTCGTSLLGQPSNGIEASESFVVLGALCSTIALGVSILRKRCLMSLVYRQRCDMVSLVTLVGAMACGIMSLVFWAQIQSGLADFMKRRYSCTTGGSSVVGGYGCPRLGFSYALCAAATFFALAGIAVYADLLCFGGGARDIAHLKSQLEDNTDDGWIMMPNGRISRSNTANSQSLLVEREQRVGSGESVGSLESAASTNYRDRELTKA